MSVAPDAQVVLPAVPALAGVYARAGAAAARLALARRRGAAPDELPHLAYTVRGVAVDPARLSAYQGLLGLRTADRLPAGFVHVLAFPLAGALMARPDFPLPLAGMLHVANRVTQRRPLFRDDRLDLQVWATGMRPHRSGTALDVVAEARRAGNDEVAWRGRSTYLARGVRVGSDTPEPDDERAAWTPPVPTASWRLAADTGRRYAEVSGDRNPVHLSALTARPFGFRRAIAHGMYTAGRALADVGPAAGHAFVWTAQFVAPLPLPVTAAVRVAPEGDGYGYAVWQPGSRRPHLLGDVSPLTS